MTSRGAESTIGTRVVRASFVVAAAHVCFKFAGFLLTMVMGWMIDAPSFESVYVVAFEGCIFFVFLIGEKVIGPAFLPMFMRELDTHDETAAWDFANALLTIQFLILLLVVFLMMFAPEAFISLLTSWDATHHAEQFAMAVRSLRWMAPALVCLSLGSTTYMLLNGYKRFFLAAFGDASWKFCTLFSVVIGTGLLGFGPRSIIFGLLVGSIAKLATHLLGLLRELRHIRPTFRWNTPIMRRMALLMLPLIVGVVFARVRENYNNIWILSRLDTGLIQASYFGRKIYQTIGWLVPYAVSIAIFPFFCELVDKEDHVKFGELLSSSARMLLSIFIPLSLVCVVLARPITEFLFRGGEFGDQAVRLTSISIACQTLVLPAYALEFLIMQAYFAKRKMTSVTAIGIAFSLLSMVVSYVGIAIYGARGAIALAVVALGFTVARTLKVVVLIAELKRGMPVFPMIETLGFLLRATLAGVAAAGAAQLAILLARAVVPASTGRLAAAVALGGGGGAAVAVFVGALFVLRIREPAEMLAWGRERIRSRFSNRRKAV